MVLLLAKQIITLYHVVQKILTKDQHTLVILKKQRILDRFWKRLQDTKSHKKTVKKL
ncbi:hypothetical protein M892_10290 [Vibrio campbellii ATCC BAA-1116]|nr:hypothetical protein M892_10290 [Vibrio campbellii ATCC BAA-1116]